MPGPLDRSESALPRARSEETDPQITQIDPDLICVICG